MKVYDVEAYERCLKSLYEEAQYYLYYVHRLDEIIKYENEYYDNFDNIVNIIHNICFWYHSIQQWLKLMVKKDINLYHYTILYSVELLQL
jgi:hypothetical protein